MIGGKDLLPNGVDYSEGENSKQSFVHGKDHPQEKKLNNSTILKDSEVCVDGFKSIPAKVGACGLQELTLSYLCDYPKLGLVQKEVAARKGKEVVVCENSNEDEKWVERDFLSLSETKENSSKRSIGEDCEREKDRGNNKKQKLETLNLSLALPDVSLSLTASNALQNGDRPIRPKASKRPTTTLNSCSNDYTAASLSYSYSHPFSHNPSCSLTRNSTENFEYSVSKDDQIWYCGEGTNGSVHSRFKPIGDGVALANHSFMQGNIQHKTASSDNQSLFPSELPARPGFETHSEGSRGKNSERGLEGVVGGVKTMKPSTSERILREIVSESIPAMAMTFKEFSYEVIASIKEHLKSLFEIPEKKEELVNLQNRLERRSDLTKGTLSKCHKEQLEILVAIKMGLASFLSAKLQFSEMVQVFLYMRCRNVNCKSLLPVDDCDCKICSGNKGFCSSCMCPICLNFDCASNTCSWVGCDVCFHWCHAACGIQRNLIKPGPSLKGPLGTSEMQFHCIGCGHASEMFGFVKDVFMCCAKDWGLETLIKELDYVRRIFKGSEDCKGKELHIKTDDMLLKLQAKLVSPSDACNYIMQFFSYADGMSEIPACGKSSKDLSTAKANHTMDRTCLSQSASLIAKYTNDDMSYSKSNDHQQKDLKTSLSELKNENDLQLLRKGGVESLECMVRIKEAEARMFQTKADEARKEAEGFQRMIKTKAAQMEEEYAERLGKLCFHEAQEMRKKKLQEFNVLKDSHFDYFNMKSRMQDEVGGLLKRMELEATKQQWV
ncbi:protein OBERON 3-like [Abrus precatorius]|uniref:Protein OBERON 3-like n=1 Tax=Abrus precatorius TaxID=3816 RepID=A0A8B8LXH5_ABRPR|nr:protein OBERON 3-like [Abrus precatorius]